MALKKKEIQLQTVISTDEEWKNMMQSEGVTVVDIHQEWTGPCKAVHAILRKLKAELGDEVLRLSAAPADNIESLKRFRDHCEPLFLVVTRGKIVARIKGANGPLLARTVTQYVEKEKKVLAGERQRSEVRQARPRIHLES
ncbi:thioredoxin domain-containing protein 3-like [Lissotriton helveticus]